MKLWEAILAGCDVTGKANEAYLRIDIDGSILACALGAACIGLGAITIPQITDKFIATNTVYGRILDFFPNDTLDMFVCHPETNEYDKLYDVIVDLNDRCMWEREKIADWLKGLDV